MITSAYGFSALYRLYETGDGWVFLAAPGPHEWLPLARALQSEVDLVSDPRFATVADRQNNDALLAEQLEEMEVEPA